MPKVIIKQTLPPDATQVIKDSAGTTLYTNAIPSGNTENQTITDSTVENSDASYTDTILAQDSLVLPDITITKPDATTISFPSVKNVDVRDYKSGIAYARPQITGQTTSYRTGDDAWAVTNRPYNAKPPYPTHHAELATFTTLVSNNAFGNTDRFTDELGGQTYANDYVIDHYTGLGWYRLAQGASTVWNTNIDNALASSLLGFTDWYVPNFKQYDSIGNRSMVGFNYTPFSLTGTPISTFQTSTTQHDTTTNYIRYQITTFIQQVSDAKTLVAASRAVLYVRNHY